MNVINVIQKNKNKCCFAEKMMLGHWKLAYPDVPKNMFTMSHTIHNIQVYCTYYLSSPVMIHHCQENKAMHDYTKIIRGKSVNLYPTFEQANLRDTNIVRTHTN